jgi:hypothetical protein
MVLFDLAVIQHFAACFGTLPARLGTLFAMLVVMLPALFSASEANFDAQLTNLLHVRAFS